MDRNKCDLKNNRGVTMVVLIITIIVLLILAAVTIGTLFGNEGTIDKAIEGNNNNQKNSIIESIKIDISAKKLIENRDITDEELQTIIEEKYNGTVQYDGENKINKVVVNNIEIDIDKLIQR